MREVLRSLREFALKVGQHWYAVVIGVIGGGLGVAASVAAAVKPKAPPVVVPLWIWVPILAVGVLVAVFRAFHDMRMERDSALAEVRRRFEVMGLTTSLGLLTVRSRRPVCSWTAVCTTISGSSPTRDALVVRTISWTWRLADRVPSQPGWPGRV
jgi:hypothetical protein